jgi:hypothetical protein
MEGKNKQGASATLLSSPAALKTGQAGAQLSAHLAFVVQFRRTSGDLSGRVEHIASGEATLFSCEQELFDFFKQILQTTLAEK